MTSQAHCVECSCHRCLRLSAFFTPVRASPLSISSNCYFHLPEKSKGKEFKKLEKSLGPFSPCWHNTALILGPIPRAKPAHDVSFLRSLPSGPRCLVDLARQHLFFRGRKPLRTQPDTAPVTVPNPSPSSAPRRAAHR
jgi:hypothetical protein